MGIIVRIVKKKGPRKSGKGIREGNGEGEYGHSILCVYAIVKDK